MTLSKKKKLLASGSILGVALALGAPSVSVASVQSNSEGLSGVPQSASDRLLFLGYSNPQDAISSEFQIGQVKMEVMEPPEMMKMMEPPTMKKT